jgi:flagellar biogenesis protein FliO
MSPVTADAGLGVFAVIGCLALLLGLLWWVRARPGVGGDGAIRLVAMRGLGGKRLLALVEIERERFLLGLTDESITCLGRLAEAPAAVPEHGERRERARAAGERG